MATPAPAVPQQKKPYDATGAALSGMLSTQGVSPQADTGIPGYTPPSVTGSKTGDTGIPGPGAPLPTARPPAGGEIPGYTPPVTDGSKGPAPIPGYTPPVTDGSKGVKPGGPGPGVTPLPGISPDPGGIDPGQAATQMRQTFQAKFGRAMTQAEEDMLRQQLGWSPGMPVTPEMVAKANDLINAYSGQLPGQQGEVPIPGYTPPPTEGQKSGEIDPNQAAANLRAAFKTKFGRDMTPQEEEGLRNLLGWTPGMPVTADMIAKANDYIAKYSGDPNNPWGPTPGAPVAPGAPAPTPATPPSATLAEQRLAELLGQSWGEVDPNSAAMRAQRDAFGLASQRNASRKRAALAERAAQRGALNAGGFDVDTERILSEQGEGEQAYEAGLITKELDGQRQRLMQGIEMAKQFGLQEQAQKLQEELAKIDLELKKYLGKGNLGLGLLQAILGNQQFADSLGLDYAKLVNLMNNQAIGAIL